MTVHLREWKYAQQDPRNAALQVKSTGNQTYDAIRVVLASGAPRWRAVLTSHGLKVLLLEAGPVKLPIENELNRWSASTIIHARGLTSSRQITARSPGASTPFRQPPYAKGSRPLACGVLFLLRARVWGGSYYSKNIVVG